MIRAIDGGIDRRTRRGEGGRPLLDDGFGDASIRPTRPAPEIAMLRRKFRSKFGRDPRNYRELQEWWNSI